VTTVLIVTVALGAGGNAAMFAFIGGLVSIQIDGAVPDAVARFEQIAALLAATSALVLFLASSTVTGLLLARARSRAHEMAVRTALGAGRARLARLCLADSLVISCIGGALGAVFGWWAANLFPLLFYVEDAEHLAMAPNAAWMVIASAVWVGVLLLSALAPIVPVWRQVPWSVLRQESSGVPAGSVRLRHRVAVAQIAVCCVLLLVAGVMRDDLQSTLRTARGQGLGSLLVVGVEGGPAYMGAVETAMLERPDVLDVAWASTLPAGWPPGMKLKVDRPQPRSRPIMLDASVFDPLARTSTNILPVAGRSFGMRDHPEGARVALINQGAADAYFAGDALGRLLEEGNFDTVEVIGVLPPLDPEVPERPSLFYYENQVQLPAPRPDAVFYTTPDPRREVVEFDVALVSASYFSLFADPPVRGRVFEPADFGGAGVAVISEAGAEAYFDGNAVGGSLVKPHGERLEVVGVVRAAPLGAAQRTVRPTLFLLMGQSFELRMFLAIRTGDVSEDTIRALGDTIRATGGGRPVTPVSTFEEHLVRNALAPERVATALVGVLALMAILLSVAGIHGTMSDLVARRRHELALRIALGARPVRLVGQVVRAGLRLALTGAGIGLGVGLLAIPLLAHVLGRIGLPSPAVLALAIAIVTLLVAISSAMPAWRAVSIDPREVMR